MAEPGGFLPVADTVDGDRLTEGAWSLIFWPRHDDRGPLLTCNLAGSSTIGEHHLSQALRSARPLLR